MDDVVPLLPHRGCWAVTPARGRGPQRIFISYRRADALEAAALIYTYLSNGFGKQNVFLDVVTIDEGAEFPDSIRRDILRADQFLIVIGPAWLTVEDEVRGGRRLDNPEDFVRREIELARTTNARVIPILVRGAAMPSRERLPEPLEWMSYRNAFVIHPETFDRDLAALVDRIKKAKPRNRFVRGLAELRSYAPVRSILWNAVSKPCAIVLAAAIAAIGYWRGPLYVTLLFLALAGLTYLSLSLVAFFSFAEAEWVGAKRSRGMRSEELAASENA
jgi:TIR domain-containing protein